MAKPAWRAWKAGSGTFRMNVALSNLPDFSALPGAGDHLTAGIILAPSLSYMDQAYRDCVRHGWSQKPIVELLIPSMLDDSSRAARRPCREPVLPARHAAICRWLVMGRITAKPSPI